MAQIKVMVGTVLKRTEVRTFDAFVDLLCGKRIRVIRVNEGNFEAATLQSGKLDVTGIPLKYLTSLYFTVQRRHRPKPRQHS